MLRVYLNGDSQTIGTDLPIDAPTDGTAYASYAVHLCSLLGGTCIANPAVGGASNERILRTTNQMLDDCERERPVKIANDLYRTGDKTPYPDFIVIGFTEYSRYDWFYNGEYRSSGAELDGLGPDEVWNEKNHQRAEWQLEHLSGEKASYGQISFYYNQMYNLHLRLEYLKIPHLFLNAHAGFYDDYGVEHRRNQRAEDLCEFDWDNCFWNVYATEDASFTSWAGKRGYKDVIGWHYEHQAHLDFSELMHQYIQDNDLVNMYKDT